MGKTVHAQISIPQMSILTVYTHNFDTITINYGVNYELRFGLINAKLLECNFFPEGGRVVVGVV